MATTSGRTTSKYSNTTSSNLFNRRQENYSSENNNSNNYMNSSSSPRRPYYKLGGSGLEDTDGEDEKKLLSLSDRIKKLSTSRVLRDSSTLTHNNNEPFTYLKRPEAQGSTRVTSNAGTIGTGSKNRREVIYAQVVVDEEKNKNFHNINMRNHNSVSNGKNKRTVHRSYNNNNYEGLNSTTISNNKTRGRNVTTVLLNSSSDDLNSSLNMDNGGDKSRFRSSSSPMLANDDGYYPKSPGIVLRQQHFQNNYNTSSRKYEDVERQFKKSSYQQSDDDEYFSTFKKPYEEDFKKSYAPGGYDEVGSGFRPKNVEEEDDDDFYNYQPINYKNGSGAKDSYDILKSSSSRGREEEKSYGFGHGHGHIDQDEDDEYKIDEQFVNEARRSRTLERDSTSFSKNRWNSTEFNRSRTLDDRLGSRKGNKTIGDEFEEEQGVSGGGLRVGNLNRVGVGVGVPPPPKSGVVVGSSGGKSKGSGNIFSTFLRRNHHKKVELGIKEKEKDGVGGNKVQQVKKGGGIVEGGKKVENVPKKSGQSGNFFTSFLEKKRKKSGEGKKVKGVKEDNTSSTYQSYNAWPPSVTVVDYSDPPTPSKDSQNNYYGENAHDTEDSNNNSSDIWKKSYGSDLKVKRRWTMREPSSSKPSVIREEEDLMGVRTSERNKSFLTTSGGGGDNRDSSGHHSLDRRNKSKNYSLNPNKDYDLSEKKYFGDETTALKLGRNKFNTIESRYSPEKSTKGKYNEEFSSLGTSGYNEGSVGGTLSRRGRKQHKGYGYGGGFIGSGGTPNSSGSESNPRNNNLVNGSLRSVYLHEAAVIPEMPRSIANSTGGGASISGLSGRRTLSKDEISNYSGPRKEQKQLSRSMSVVAPWGPNKTYREKYKEVDYSQSNNLHLPPRPPSRSPSGSGFYRQQITKGESPSRRQSPSKQHLTTSSNRPKPPSGGGTVGRTSKKPVVSSSVESLLRQDTPDLDGHLMKKKGNSKLGRSKSIAVPSSNRDGKNSRFSTLWFNKKNHNK